MLSIGIVFLELLSTYLQFSKFFCAPRVPLPTLLPPITLHILRYFELVDWIGRTVGAQPEALTMIFVSLSILRFSVTLIPT